MLCPLLLPFPDVCHSQHQVGSSPRARNSFLMYHRRVRVPATWTVICSLPVIRGNSAEAKNVCFLGPRESQCQDSVWHCAVGYGSTAGLCPAVRPYVAVLIHLQHCVGSTEYYHGPVPVPAVCCLHCCLFPAFILNWPSLYLPCSSKFLFSYFFL